MSYSGPRYGLSSSSSSVGRWGETLACSILQDQGFTLLHKNWRPQPGPDGLRLRGEIDCVMVDQDLNLVFVEVKTRTGEGFGHPFESITRDKGQKLRELAYAWCSENTGDYRGLRIDAVAIWGTPDHFTFEHRKAVV
ncbi:YraN family protein [Rothia nasimurium]|uniref:YraN family protein n=1 Tax=Rothia nasimurium TaxID=85336 RepID=UPI001F1E1073|nr:YraN family protein [Rothia nasimurium]